MRNWIIKLLGGVDKATFDRLCSIYERDLTIWKETVERHNLHAAWEQTKQEYKIRRLH